MKKKRNIALSVDTFEGLKDYCDQHDLLLSTELKNKVREFIINGMPEPLYEPSQPHIWRTVTFDDYAYKEMLSILNVPESIIFETAARAILEYKDA